MQESENYSKIPVHLLIATSLTHIIKLILSNKFIINNNLKLLLNTIFKLIKLTHFRLLTRTIDKIIYVNKIKKEKLKNDPIFIIGHWRSGTSFLHDYLCQDKNFGYIDTFQVFFPTSFISNEKAKEDIKEEFPKTRPMDNVEMNFDFPFEDEFAIFLSSGYSFYNFWFFPQNINMYFNKYVLFKNLSKNKINKWKNDYLNLIKKVSSVNNWKQLLLKNPVNTAKINQLLEIFPNAKFIYIHRNPYNVYNSTLKVHQILLESQSLQRINLTNYNLEKKIINYYNIIIKKYNEDKKKIPDGNLCELTYELLTEDPIKQLELIYKKLSLSNFEQNKQNFINYHNKVKNYKTSRYKINNNLYEDLKLQMDFGFMVWDKINNS